MKRKKIVNIFIFLLFFISCVSKPDVRISSSFKNKRAKIAVLPFVNIGKEGIDQSESDQFTTYCMDMGFIVVERNELQKVFNELNLEMTGALSRDNINKVGKLLGVDMIVTGTRKYYQGGGGCVGGGSPQLRLFSQSIKFIGVETGEIMISSYCEVDTEPHTITRKMAAAIKERMFLYIDLKKI